MVEPQYTVSEGVGESSEGTQWLTVFKDGEEVCRIAGEDDPETRAAAESIAARLDGQVPTRLTIHVLSKVGTFTLRRMVALPHPPAPGLTLFGYLDAEDRCVLCVESVVWNNRDGWYEALLQAIDPPQGWPGVFGKSWSVTEGNED